MCNICKWNEHKNLDLNNFENSILLTTGASDTCKKMNIYDLAGNVEEYTLESGTVSTTKPCICRGSFSTIVALTIQLLNVSQQARSTADMIMASGSHFISSYLKLD